MTVRLLAAVLGHTQSLSHGDVDGAFAPTGPLVVAEQLPDSNILKPVGLEFRKSYESKYGAGTLNPFAGYAYDAWLVISAAVPQAMKKAKPGTPEFRQSLRDAIESVQEVVGTHGVYSMSATDHNGVDKRARVVVRVDNGRWRLIN